VRLRIEDLIDEPIAEVRYLNAASGGGTVVERLPIVRATLVVEGELSDELDAIVACSDLQGIVRGLEGRSELLGIAVADALEELAFDGALPPLARCGAILAGDLYSVPEANKRGGHGEVTDVWAAFAARFAWVAGVAGNHDDVSNVPAIGDTVHLLDGDVVELDGLRIGGVGGIIGNPRKPGRREEAAYLALLERTLDLDPSIVVLHEGPNGDDDQRGISAIRELLEAGGTPLAIRGHDHWERAIAELDGGQVLNVDARCVVLAIKR
jgi:Icc protein